MRKLILILAFITAGVSSPAYKGDIEFKQQDGSTFVGNLNGDEWFNWIEDKHSNVIKYNNQSKNYEYAIVEEVNGVAELVPSGSPVAEGAINRTQSTIAITRDILSKIGDRKRNEALAHNKIKEDKK
jgi:hypothetical protein